MEFFDVVSNRKSVRKYLSKPVPRNLIEKVIDAGRQAPSGNNVQPVEYVVITKAEMRKKIAAMCDYGRFIADAPVCIAVFSKDTKYYLEDGCAAVENILLAATALGLGTCWVAGDKKHYARPIGRLLNVPPRFKLIALVALGYEDGTSIRKTKRALKEVLHWETYS